MSISIESLPGLMVFARIATQGSVSGAAKSLGLSRSAVSKQLATFEAQIGAKLIHRTTRRLSLTELGTQVLKQAQEVETALLTVGNLTDGYSSEINGKLKVSCSTSIGRTLLLPLLKEFHARFPAIELQLELEDRFVDLVQEQVDVAIRLGHLADSSLIARRLGELTWQICASPEYLDHHGAPEKPEDLTKHPCLCYSSSRQQMNLWNFSNGVETSTVKVHGPLAINDTCALVDAALSGMGILLIDRAIVIQHIKAGRLVALLPNHPPSSALPVYAVYPAREYLPSKTHAFVEFLLEKLSPQIV